MPNVDLGEDVWDALYAIKCEVHICGIMPESCFDCRRFVQLRDAFTSRLQQGPEPIKIEGYLDWSTCMGEETWDGYTIYKKPITELAEGQVRLKVTLMIPGEANHASLQAKAKVVIPDPESPDDEARKKNILT